MTSSINSDYVTPITHLARTPSTIHYSAAISARLSYFMAQQSVISSTVGGKFTVDPVALPRAVLAALAGGREEPIVDAMRIIPDEKITSTESYAWWSRNLKGIVAVMKCVLAGGGWGGGVWLARLLLLRTVLMLSSKRSPPQFCVRDSPETSLRSVVGGCGGGDLPARDDWFAGLVIAPYLLPGTLRM